MSNLELSVYLSGEIHTDWRQQIVDGAASTGVTAHFSSAVTDHATSDNCGVDILGPEDKPFWKDHKGAKVNAVRNRALMNRCDVVVVRFGDKYRQWNAAFDAGQAVAMGKSLITLHDESLDHALKEINGAALATTRTPEEVVRILKYVSRGLL